MAYVVSLVLLISICCIQQSTSANCTFEIFSRPDNSGYLKVEGQLSCPQCSISNNCNLGTIFEDCSMGDCNKTYQLCNLDNNVATNGGKHLQNGSEGTTEPNQSTQSELNNSKESKSTTESLDTSHTPATITVCPTQTPLMIAHSSLATKITPKSCSIWSKETSITKTSTVVITTVLCTNNDERRKECTDMTSIQAMGAVTGLLIVILATMTTGYLYICWNMKKRGEIRSGLKKTASFPKTRETIINTLNHTDKTLRRFNNPLYMEGGPEEFPPPATGVDHSPVAQPRDGEPAYEAILPPGMTGKRSLEMLGSISHHEANGDKQMQALGGVSVGAASQEGCGQGVLELSQVGLEDEDIENHYHLLGSEELDGQRLNEQELRGEDIENHYHLLDSEEEDEKMRHMTNDECDHHILKQNKLTNQENKDVSTIESDYYLLGSVEETAEQQREESMYHVLEMPGHDDNDYEDPDEGELFQDYDERRREREIERSTRIARACDVPVISYS